MTGTDDSGDEPDARTAVPRTGSGRGDSSDRARADWPVELTGVTESLVTTLGPNERWNVAPLGLFAGDPVTAKTWGRTRTRRNFERTGEGYVQFTTDPVRFVDAALSIVEESEPVLAEADAWVRVDVTRLEAGGQDGTEWVRWALEPAESAVRSKRVPTLSRARGAVLEASVAASRLDVPGHDPEAGRRTIARAADVVDRTGGPRETEAFDRLREHVDLDLSADD